MTRKRLMSMVGAICLLIVFWKAPVWAEDSEHSRTTLAGLQGVTVIIEDFQPNVQKYAARDGLTKEQILRDVTQRLNAAGIKTVYGAEWQKLPGQPMLYININTHETEKYWFAYDVKVALRQAATLDANPHLKTFATTWSLNITGQANIGTLHLLRQDTGVMTDRFVQAYRLANKQF